MQEGRTLSLATMAMFTVAGGLAGCTTTSSNETAPSSTGAADRALMTAMQRLVRTRVSSRLPVGDGDGDVSQRAKDDPATFPALRNIFLLGVCAALAGS